MNKILFILLMSCILLVDTLCLNAQNSKYKYKTQVDKLNELCLSIQNSQSDAQKKNLNKKFDAVIKSLLENNSAQEFPFDSLLYVFHSFSADKRLRIINWNLVFSDGTYQYFGFVQLFQKKQSTKIVPLHDKSDEIKNPEYQSLNPLNWYGALYYNILDVKERKSTYYILFGWDGYDDFTDKKIIEVLWIDETNNIHFGKNILEMKDGPKQRVIFQFKNRVYMTLRYDEREKLIVFDQLAPQNALVEGRVEYYGPDGTYNALKKVKGAWKYQDNVDIRNPKK